MSEQRAGQGWDYNVGLVLAVLGGFALVVKFKVIAYLVKLWPLLLIWLGWRLFRRADEHPETPEA